MQTSSEYVLRVERGRTRFPERALTGDRFLIGAGSNCQLQLGGEIPLLHSIIVPEDDHLWIDAVVGTPPLVVNGQAVRESVLLKGDLIEIGGFVFCVDRQPASPNHVEIKTPAEMSAAELTDSLDQELNLLEELEQPAPSGMRALLEAAARKQSGNTGPVDANQSMLEDLQRRARELDQREEMLRQLAEQLEQSQRELQEQLRATAGQGTQTSDEDGPELRLTA